MMMMTLERDKNTLPPSSCSLNAGDTSEFCMHDANLLGLHVQVHIHEDPSMHFHEDEIHVDTFLHIHDEATAMNSIYEDKCIHEDKYRQHAYGRINAYQRTADMNMDVINHHADCSPPPPPFDSSDTSLASPHSFLDPHPYPADLLAFFQGSNPVKEEIDRLQNDVKEKNRELVEARAEIKALKITERSREKALEELADELTKVDERLARAELLLENKNLELKRTIEEKREAQAAQHAAEAVVRRIQSAQMRDEELPPLEAILAPLDSELKLTRQEVARLQEDNRALDRLTKSKEAALLEAERTVQIATSKASLVDDLQNKNQELMKHIDSCQEENKVLDKMHRQKITEVEKLSIRVAELEELLLSSGPNEANAARDYQRQLYQLQEEKKALERELARVKITANRVAAVVANGWKGSNDKVMPVKHWLEERRLLQSEMEQLREKLASMERAAKAEANLKEKLQLRLKVLEESLMLNRPSSNIPRARRPNITGAAASPMVGHAGLHSVVDYVKSSKGTSVCNRVTTLVGRTLEEDMQGQQFYDLLQKEVITLRRACQQKDCILSEKENAIEMLEKKVCSLNRSMETESKKLRREVVTLEKEVATLRTSVASSPHTPSNFSKHRRSIVHPQPPN